MVATKRTFAAWTACTVVALGLAGGTARGQDIVIGQFGDPFDEFVDCPFGWTCTPGFPSASFLINFPDANDPTMGGALQLTPPGLGGLAVSAFANTPYDIQTNRMRATFDLFIAGDADGLTFAIVDATTNNPDYVGGAGGSLGWGGAVQGMAIEFDIYDNGGNADPDDNHVGVNLNGSLVSEATSSSAAGPGIELCTIGFELGSATIYNVEVEFDNGHLEVHMTGGTLPGRVKMLDVNLPPFPSDQALFGFTAGTGGANAQQIVDNLQISLTPGVSAPPSTTLQTLVLPFAVNCGSGARVTGDGVDFEPDQRYREGTTRYGWVAVPGQDAPVSAGPPACDDEVLPLVVPADPPGLEGMYETARAADSYENFGYRFLVGDGTYEVTIYGAELAALYPEFGVDALLDALQCYGNPRMNGLRRMDVVAEGIKVLDNFAFAELAGDEFMPAFTKFRTTVRDGVLDLDFAVNDFGIVEDLGGAAIHGIKIERVVEAPVEVLTVAHGDDTLVFQDGRELPDGSIYAGTRDTTVMEQSPDNNNGKSDLLEIGRTGPETSEDATEIDDRSVLLRFDDLDVSSFGNRALVSATITLQYFSTRPTDDDDIGFQVNGEDYLFGHCPHLTVEVAGKAPICADVPVAPTLALCAGDTKTVQVHQLLTAWNEGTIAVDVRGAPAVAGGATWNHPQGAPMPLWDGGNATGHAEPASLASIPLTEPVQAELGAVGAGGLFAVVQQVVLPNTFETVEFPSFGPMTINATDLVRGWLDGSIPNHGILLREEPGNEGTFKGTRILKSREWPSIVDRPSLTLVFGDDIPQGPPPELMQIAEGVGRINADTDLADTFISPKGEGVAFDRVTVELSEEAEMVGAAEVAWTGDAATKPGVAELVSDGDGRHTLVFDGPLEVGQWAKVTLTVRALATQAEGTITLWVAHFPNDLNQDATINIRDASEFGMRFRDAIPVLLLIDLNDDGGVNVRDATEFGQQWFAGWRNRPLPDKPA